MQTTETKTVSRQRLYQIRKQAEGKCITCGNRRSETSSTYCEHHHNLVRVRQDERRMKSEMRRKGVFPAKLWSKALDAFVK